jgi:DNA-binding SARP family transcriptional activator
VQRLVAFIALRSRPVRRPFVAGNLWPEVPEARAAANLRATVWRLPPTVGALLAGDRTEISLDAGVHVDYWSAIASARTLIDLDAGTVRPASYDPDLELDLLPGWDDEWVSVERERLRQLRLHAIESVCAGLIEAGDAARAIDLAVSVAETEPLRESTQRLLIGAHLAEGNQLEAIETYERYRARVDDRLGLRPSRLMDEMMASLGASG